MVAITANGITVEMETHGDAGNPAMLMIRGLGSQIIHWPSELIEGLVAAGYHVITYDNRDAGLSQAFADAPDYSVMDMAADGIGVLDALGIKKAHAFGISMGGMILQAMICAHPERLLSGTIVMSSSRAENLPGRNPEVEALLSEDMGDPAEDMEAVIANILRADYAWFNPGFPFDEDARRKQIRQAIERSWRPDGTMRQYQAILRSGNTADRLKAAKLPALVIHGNSDTLVPAEHGRDIAARIPGAKYLEIAGMGHDLDGGVSDIILKETTAFLSRL